MSFRYIIDNGTNHLLEWSSQLRLGDMLPRLFSVLGTTFLLRTRCSPAQFAHVSQGHCAVYVRYVMRDAPLTRLIVRACAPDAIVIRLCDLWPAWVSPLTARYHRDSHCLTSQSRPLLAPDLKYDACNCNLSVKLWLVIFSTALLKIVLGANDRWMVDWISLTEYV